MTFAVECSTCTGPLPPSGIKNTKNVLFRGCCDIIKMAKNSFLILLLRGRENSPPPESGLALETCLSSRLQQKWHSRLLHKVIRSLIALFGLLGTLKVLSYPRRSLTTQSQSFRRLDSSKQSQLNPAFYPSIPTKAPNLRGAHVDLPAQPIRSVK